MGLDWQTIVLIFGLIITAPIWLTILCIVCGFVVLTATSLIITVKKKIMNLCKGALNK